MHGQKNIKLHNAEQAKPVYQYKNTKIKLYTNNAAIWYNKENCALKLVDEIHQCSCGNQYYIPSQIHRFLTMASGLGQSSSTQKLGVSILKWKGTGEPTQLVPTEQSLSSVNKNDSFYSTRLNMWLPIILPENRTDQFPETQWSFHKMLDNRQSR